MQLGENRDLAIYHCLDNKDEAAVAINLGCLEYTIIRLSKLPTMIIVSMLQHLCTQYVICHTSYLCKQFSSEESFAKKWKPRTVLCCF